MDSLNLQNNVHGDASSCVNTHSHRHNEMSAVHAIPDRIKELITLYGVKQSFLCDETGLTSSFISQLLHGKKSVSLSVLSSICDAFHITLSEFFQPLDACAKRPYSEHHGTVDFKSYIGAMLAYHVRRKGILQKDFARSIGVSEIHLSKVIHGENGITMKRLEDICSALNVSVSEFFCPSSNGSHFSALYLNTLMNKCLKLSKEDIRILEALADRFLSSTTASEPMYLASVSGSAAAGAPLYDPADSDAVLAVPRKYCDSSRYLIFQARGDSMEPRIRNGSYVVARRGESPGNGDIAVVRVASGGEDEYVVKRFYRMGDTVELRSINKKYAPIKVSPDALLSADRVVACLPAPVI